MGYIKIDRKLLDSPLWADKPFAEGQAWIDLLLLADYETKCKKWKGATTVFKRGSVNTSMQLLAERWGWSRSRTRTFMDKLINAERISIETHNRQRTVITILKYDVYQDTPKKITKKSVKKADDEINWSEV